MNNHFRLMALAILLMSFLSGCTTTEDGKPLDPVLPFAEKSTIQDVSRLLENPKDSITVYFFAERIHGANDLAVSLNGRASSMGIRLDGEVVANLQEGEAIKLQLMPHHLYPFAFKNTFWMDHPGGLAHFPINATTAGNSAAFSIATPVFVGNTPDVKRLNLKTLRQKIEQYTFVEPLIDRSALALRPTKLLEQWSQCLIDQNLGQCESVFETVPTSLRSEMMVHEMEVLRSKAQQKQKTLAAMETALPESVRRDKYMITLSSHLKSGRYQEALAIFPKLKSLSMDTDPSLDFFYGESLLKTGQPKAALTQLYSYISTQGRAGTHYARALKLINEAESQLR